MSEEEIESPPVRQHAALLPAMQVRVSSLQRTYLLLLAEAQHCSLSEAVRRLIDASIDREPPVEGVTDSNTGIGLSLRRVLEMADHKSVQPDTEWLSNYGDGE